MSALRRLISPNTNAPGIMSAVALLVAVLFALSNHGAHPHANPIDTKTLLALASSVGSLLTRFTTTPITDPHNGAGDKLMTSTQHAADALQWSMGLAEQGRSLNFAVTPAPDAAPAEAEPPLAQE